MTANDRRYDVDALRVLAFALLILYHVGMFYVADWDWHIKSTYTSVWLQEPMRFTNQWRMALLFVISGLATSFVVTRYAMGQLARRRLLRLGLPLIFGMAVVVAPQPYFEALDKGVIEPGFLAFWKDYLTFQDFPGEAWGGENVIVWTWNHLWYLPYVLLYTLVTLPLVYGIARDGKPGSALFQRLRGPWLVCLPLIPLQLYGTFVFPHFPYINHGLTSDVYAHLMYGTLFFYGACMGRDEAFWSDLTRRRRPLLILGVLSYAALRAQSLWAGESPGPLLEQLATLNVYVNRWTWILILLAYAHRYLNTPRPWLRYATLAVFPWYVLHQSLTVVAGGVLAPLALGPVLEPLLVLGITVAGCAVIYEGVIRRIPGLGLLFGGPPGARSAGASSDAAKASPSKAAHTPSANRVD